MSHLAFRRGLGLSRPSIFLGTPIRAASAPAGTRAIAGGAISTPKVAQPSFWISLVPKFLRRSSVKKPTKPQKDWNPATYFIVMFLMVGSMSIQMITLKKDFATFTRRTDVRITLLRETIEKLQRGEEVDVERVLGTGDLEHEQQWQDVLKEIERDEVVKEYQQKQKVNVENTKAVEEPTQSMPEQPKSTTTVTSDTTGFF